MLNRRIVNFIKSTLPINQRASQEIYFTWFVLSALVFLIPLCPAFFYLEQDRPGYTTLWMILSVSLSFLAWRFARLPLALANGFYQCTLLGAILYNAWYMGGVASPVMVWLGILPVLPVFVSRSRVWVYFWLVLSFSSVFVFYLLQTRGMLDMPPHMTHDDLAFTAMMYLVLVVSQIALVHSLDLLNESNLRRIRRSNDRLNTLSIDLRTANSHKDQFLAMVSHEMRTPLNAVMGYLSLMSTDQRLPTDAIDFVKGAQNAAAHLLTVINDLLDFSQIQNGQITLNPQIFNLHAMLHKTHSSLLPRAIELGLEYKLVLGQSVPQWVLADQHRLTQILINLLGNALKFTNQGHVITHVGYTADGSSTDLGSLCIQVEDTGQGIPVEAQQKIFEPFVQLTHADGQASPRDALRGNGLGLSITRTLVKSHGGSLDLTSEVGKGSVFAFTIPITAAPAPAKAAPVLDRIDHTPIKLLIVDDHAVNRMVATATIARSLPNARIDQAENGTQGLEKMRTELYDLVLLDLVMPDIDGVEVMRRVRTTFPAPYRDVQIIALTANVADEALRACKEVGVNEVMPKPFDRMTLINRIIHHCIKPDADTVNPPLPG